MRCDLVRSTPSRTVDARKRTKAAAVPAEDACEPPSKLARFRAESRGAAGEDAGAGSNTLLLDDQSSTIHGVAGNKACVSIAVQTISWFLCHPSALLQVGHNHGGVGELLTLEAELTQHCLERGVEKHMSLPTFIKQDDESVLNSEAILYAELRPNVSFTTQPISGCFQPGLIGLEEIAKAAWSLEPGDAALFLYEHTSGTGHAVAFLRSTPDSLVLFDSAVNTPLGSRAILIVSRSFSDLVDEIENHLAQVQPGNAWQIFFVEAREKADEQALEKENQETQWWRDNAKEWVKRAANMSDR